MKKRIAQKVKLPINLKCSEKIHPFKLEEPSLITSLQRLSIEDQSKVLRYISTLQKTSETKLTTYIIQKSNQTKITCLGVIIDSKYNLVGGECGEYIVERPNQQKIIARGIQINKKGYPEEGFCKEYIGYQKKCKTNLKIRPFILLYKYYIILKCIYIICNF